jgi:SNF2 family DNA or RNA helicase
VKALRPYQELMIDHIIKTPRCAVWAFMGAGKSVSTLTALDRLALVENVFPALIIAPLRVAESTWATEASEWPHLQHLRVSKILGIASEREAATKVSADIYTINFENIPWLINRGPLPYKTIIVDESTKLKGFRGSFQTHPKSGKVFLRKGGGERTSKLALPAHKASRFIELTGTPAPNGLVDTWAQLWFLDRGQRLGRSFSAFEGRWFRAKRDGFGIEPLPNAQEEIQNACRDLCITLKSEDWFDLREVIHTTINVELPPKVRAQYKKMEKEFFIELAEGGSIEAVSAAAKSGKLRQIASGAAYTETGYSVLHDAKLDALESLVEEAGGAPVMVSYYFKSDLERLQKRFPQGQHLDGNTKTITAWNTGKIPILFAHPKSAGHGLNLQHGGNILVFFSHDWNLEERDQIAERIGPVRQLQAGYNRNVFVYDIVARNTIDELVIERHRTKRTVQNILMDAMKASA